MDVTYSPTTATQFGLSSKEKRSLLNLRTQVLANWPALAVGDYTASHWLEQKVADSLSWYKRHTSHQYVSELISNTLIHSHNYSWNSFLDNTNCRAGLLIIPPGGYLPMHDHPESIGFSIVLKGHPIIIQRDRVSAVRSNVTEPLHVQEISSTKLYPSQITYTFPVHNNIHGFCANDNQSAVLFNVVFINEPVKRHWYLSSSTDSLQQLNYQFLRNCMFCAAFAFAKHAVGCDLQEAYHLLSTNQPVIAAQLLITCANDGHPVAQSELANLYVKGNGVQQDIYEAANWYRRAAEGGMPEAQFQYGNMLLEGKGVTQDSSEALYWLFESAQSGHNDARKTFNYLMTYPEPLDC